MTSSEEELADVEELLALAEAEAGVYEAKQFHREYPADEHESIQVAHAIVHFEILRLKFLRKQVDKLKGRKNDLVNRIEWEKRTGNRT